MSEVDDFLAAVLPRLEEHTSATVEGQPQSYALRVTHVYRRENGEWRIVHRHGDPAPASG